MIKKQSILEKKRFHLLKRHLDLNGMAQNMPVVAGRLVGSIRLLKVGIGVSLAHYTTFYITQNQVPLRIYLM